MVNVLIQYIIIMVLIVGTINVRSICSKWRRAVVLEELSNVKAELICVQECGMERAVKEEWIYGMSLWAPRCNLWSEGVGILVQNPHTLVQCISHEVVAPRRMKVAVLIMRVINCYVPADRN